MLGPSTKKSPASGLEAVSKGQGLWSNQILRRAGAGFLAFLIMLLATLVLYLVLRDRLAELQGSEQMTRYGYAAVFFIGMASTASVFVPLPGPVAVFVAGSMLNPVFVGLVAGVAEALGELTGYGLGYAGRGTVERSRPLARLESWMRRHGALTIFVVSVIPNPVADFVGVASGAARFPVWKFLAMAWAGKTLKALGLALAGAWGVERILDWLEALPG